MRTRSSYGKLPRWARAGIFVGIIVLLYTGFGFLIAPRILKAQVISSITKNLGLQASIYQVKMNPYELSVAVKGFELNAPDNERLAGFGELFVNFQLSSIFRRAYTFDEIRLLSPYGLVKILPDGSLALSRLLAKSNSATPPQAAPATPPAQEGKLPSVLIYRLEIDQGRVDFKDMSRPTPFESSVFPIQIKLTNFSTRRDSESPYAFTAAIGKQGMLNWDGNVSINPIRSSGRVELIGNRMPYLSKYIQDQVRFEIASGVLDLTGRYYVEAGGGPIRFRLDEGQLKLRELKIADKSMGDTLISIPAFTVEGISVDLDSKRAVLASVTSSDAQLLGWLAPDGTFNYQQLFAMDNLKFKSAKSSASSGESVATGKPWQITVNDVTLQNYGIAVEDRRQREPVRVELAGINANLKNITNQKNSPVDVTLDLKVNKTGTVSAKGKVTPMPVSADLDLQVASVDLKPFEAYVESFAQLDFVSGAGGLNGKVKYRSVASDEPKVSYQGKIDIDKLRTVDRIYSEDLLKWKSLAFNDVNFSVEPTKLSISGIVAKEPYAKVIIRPDRTTNLSSVFPRKDTQGAKAASSASKPQAQAPMPITIGTVRVEKGSAYFADLSLKPNFFTDMQSLNGTIKGLSSKSLARADVLLEGKVDKYAPVKISGQINPLSKDVYTDLTLNFQNFELTSLTPYSGKFAGYAIEKGKLSLDLKYKLSENVLIGENKIVLDQLTLGERVESPDAIKLPIGLAIALLKDRNGVINIDLPVRGDLNDPQFSYGRIIWQALLNLIGKAVTSPFALLGNLIGGSGEELSFVEFDFGNATPRPDQLSKLDNLAKALSERPTLRLEVKGASNRQSDWPALAEAELLNQMKRARFEELRKRKKAPETFEEIVLTDEDYDRLLTQIFVNAFGKKPEAILGIAAETPTQAEQATPEAGKPAEKPKKPQAVERAVILAAAKKQLIDSAPVDDAALQRLAQDRATHIKDYLIQKGQMPENRVFMVEPEIAGASEGTDVRVNLTLSAS